MSKATDRATIGIAQWKDMTRAVEVLGGLCGIGQGPGGEGAVMGRDTGGSAVGVVDRDCVGGLPDVLVVGHHQGQLEFL